jgi:hypothetical protein
MIQTIITEHELEIIHKLIHDVSVYDWQHIATLEEIEYLKNSLPPLTRDMELEVEDIS